MTNTSPGIWVDVLDHWTAYMRAAGRPKSTINLRLYHLRRMAAETGTPPYELTTDRLLTFLGNPTWSPGYRRSIRSSIRNFYAWSLLTERTTTNPAALLPTVSVPLGKPRPASDRSVAVGLTYIDRRVRLMVQLGAHAGLRCSEIARVHSGDLQQDLLGWSLRVIGKGGRVRVVPIGDDLAGALHACPDGWVFPGQIDGHLSGAYVSKLISRALPEGTTAHPLRHRYASRAFRGSGYNLRAVQELLGHSSVSTTQIYTAVDDDELRRAALSVA